MRSLMPVMAMIAVMFATNVNGREEPFPQQENLSIFLETSGGFKGSVFLQDGPDPGKGHEERMLSALEQSVPKKNIVAFKGAEGTLREIEKKKGGWTSGYYEKELKKNNVRVIQVPSAWHHEAAPSVREAKIRVLKSQNILAVYSAGNFSSVLNTDIYQPNNPYWGNDFELAGESYDISEYEDVKNFFQSGYAILAAYAVKKPATFEEFVGLTYGSHFGDIEESALKEMYLEADEYVRHPFAVRPGDLKEHGFTYLSSVPWWEGTSAASAHVAAFAFYLYQLWDTTAEVLEVMQKTAIDIGEPGVDEEFGWGLINANHPIIWDRAAKKLGESLEICLFEDVSFEQAMATSGKSFAIFHHVESKKKKSVLFSIKIKPKLHLQPDLP